MAIKKWNCEYNWYKIEFINEWEWSGYTKEELLVDWKSVFMEEKDMDSAKSVKDIMDMMWARIIYQLDKNTIIEIIAWSAWHLFWVAAKILANWKQIWWDKIVLFAKKK